MTERAGETVRFAPSPTGEMHIGNARTALYNACLARRTGGRFVLRLDDTDAARSHERFVAQIERDLTWLAIVPDRVERQSERLALYDEAAERLRAAGLLYPCYETPQELERKRARQRARGRPPIYDRAGLALAADERRRLEAAGRRPHWRFRLPQGARTWDDRCRGPQTVDLGTLSDPVLVRADGSYLYTLPSVVDDIDMGVTTVVRGEDHVTNTAVQIALFEALGARAPAFAHHNLLVRADGEPLSKRDNPLSLSRLREAGYEAMAVASLAVLTGTHHPVQPVTGMAALCAFADLGAVSRAPATFDPAELDRLNAALLHAMPFELVADWLRHTFGVADAQFWETVRANLSRREEIRTWFDVWRRPPALSVAEAGADPEEGAKLTTADADVLAAAPEALPPGPFDPQTFRAWTEALRARTGKKGRALVLPLRKALTGLGHGPEMAALLPLLGRTAVLERLERARALLASAAEASERRRG